MLKFIFDHKNRHFMRLWWSQLISQFGDRLNQMALIGLIAERTPGSATSLAKLLSFTIIPVFIVGPVAGVYVDRWDKRRTLFVCDLLRSALVLTIPFVFMLRESMVPIYVVVFLMFCFSRFYVPAKMAIIPDLIHKENLLMANSMISVTGMIAFVLGCALGGFLVDKIGARYGFFGDALTFFVSGMLIFSITRDIHLHIDREEIIKKGRELIELERTVFGDIKEGVRYLVRHREIRFIISMLFVLLSAAGAVYVVIIVFIQQSFDSVTRDLGLLAVCLGLGLFSGVLLYGRFGKKIAWYKTIFLCLIAGGVMMTVFTGVVSHYTNIISAGVLSAALGLVLGPVFIVSNTVVHLVADEKMRGKVFSALEIVIHFAFLLAMLISSSLSEIVTPGSVLLNVAAVFFLVGVAGLVRYRGGDLPVSKKDSA